MSDPADQILARFNQNLERLLDYVLPSVAAGVFDGFRAFRVLPRGGVFHVEGIPHPDPVQLDELKGVPRLLEDLCRNTEQFLRGAPCNHVLLYGPRGTGKSSAVKALLNAYGDNGLRIMEIPKDALLHFPAIGSLIEGRNEKYILFCDDLSFDEEDRSFRELKAVLEGGLARRPENLLIYATSNRRHLMREYATDSLPLSANGELHPAETLEEKVSLSDRFGLRLGFPRFDRETYLEIVGHYLGLRNLDVNRTRAQEAALRWALGHGSFSGRAARQFVDDLEGRLACGESF